MQIVLFDVETDGLDYTKIHCISVSVAHWSKPLRFTSVSKFNQWARENTSKYTLWVAHNACGFDFWVINELTDVRILRRNIVDTSVLTKLKDYSKYRTHSLKEIGEDLGVFKGEYEGDWDEYTEEMGEYCDQDVMVLKAIWDRYGKVLTDYPEACRVEHEMALIAHDMQADGFQFNTHDAALLLGSVQGEMNDLEAEMQKQWPPELVVDRTIQWRVKEDGTPYATCLKAMDTAPKWERKGEELVLYKYKEFNPGSPKDRVDKLWDAGWVPYDKTKGHQQYERDKRSQWRR